MDDAQIWDLEESLWTGGAERYQELVDEACVMVLPSDPFIMTGQQAIDAVSETPRWSQVRFSGQQTVHPEGDLVVIAYHAAAQRKGADDYQAYCTTTWQRRPNEEWRVVQHQQTPPITAGAG
ncbi:nuclear transport factor 2 family protein [Plastoroseomonas arctica]|uniref:Nuclear transport factor 2 family protein n=1 Tax=Plastoroseomonas arctica TaxID=1509237 RepID=A0AAF1KPY9_9PROT|nr:nuclear transport factor 2 family protein [Plastoroseomonas arctica]MBR0656743.1 nuclear transport factor 2 family protein [Plastoroseomonas arctica]